MADPNEVSQFIVEVGAETGPDQDSQLVVEVAATTGPEQASQFVAEVAATTGPDQASQFIAEVAQSTGPDRVSQLTIELLLGPTVAPPSSSVSTTELFDEGEGESWYLSPVLSDSGDDLRDKVIKAIALTGKVTRCTLGVFAFGPTEEVDMDAIEGGNVFSRTNVIPIPDTTGVVRCERQPVNVKNAGVHTCRAEGIWDGVGIRDRIDEIVYEVASQGRRR